MNGTLGIDIRTAPSPMGVMVGIASWSGGGNSKMRAFFDSPTLDTTTFIASSQLILLLISKSKPERSGIRCCTKVMHQKGPHKKYAAADSIKAAPSTYAPTAKQMSPPPSQRVAFLTKEDNLDNGHRLGPCIAIKRPNIRLARHDRNSQPRRCHISP